MTKTLSIVLALSILPAVHAAGETQISVGAGVGVAPEYIGSDKYRVTALPAFRIQHDAFFLDSERGLGAEYVNEDSGTALNASINYDAGRSEKRKNKDRSLRGMGKVKGGAMLQLGASQQITPQISVSADANIRLSGQKRHGNRYRLGIAGDIYQSEQDTITLGADVHLADRNYQQTYFGVTAEQSARSGYRAYKPKAGVYAYGVSAGWMHNFDEHWSVGVGVEAQQLAGKAKNSPLVKSKTQISVGALVQYRF